MRTRNSFRRGHRRGLLTSTWGEPYGAADLANDTVMPDAVTALGGSDAYPA